ncbi:MAG: redoxin domain-containing protein [Bacteroidaceae bacterium]|nr:redoxin domain-containing protein [Bacteroidaceae bacterium]
MKKISIIAAFTLALSSCSGEYNVNVNFDNDVADGEQVVLINFDSGDTLAIDSVENGKAILSGEIKGSVMGRILAAGGRTTFVLEKGDINLDFSKRQATGTELNDKFNELNSLLNAESERAGKVIADEKAGKITEAQREKLYKEATDNYFNILFKAYEQNKDNAIGPWALTSFLSENEMSIEELTKLIDEAPSEYKKLTRIQKLFDSKTQAAKTAIGQAYTDFTISGEDGLDDKLSNYVKPGMITIVDFWASWCPPCRREIAEKLPDGTLKNGTLKDIFEKYGERINLVGVAVWDKPEDTLMAIDGLQIPWPVMFNAQKIPTDIYGITSIPHIMIIGKDGKIASRGLTGESLKAKVDELMAE